MKSNSISRLLVAMTPTTIVFTVLALGACAVAEGPGTGPCSNRTLFGDYGFTIEGTILGPNIPIRGLAMQHYDGKGGITQVDHFVTDGVPEAQEWTPGTGTYAVNSDCTGSAVINSPSNPYPINLHFVVVDQGKQINQVVDANAVTAVGRRVN